MKEVCYVLHGNHHHGSTVVSSATDFRQLRMMTVTVVEVADELSIAQDWLVQSRLTASPTGLPETLEKRTHQNVGAPAVSSLPLTV